MIEYAYICSDSYLINTQSDSDEEILETIVFLHILFISFSFIPFL